jgi:hypothetical protein
MGIKINKKSQKTPLSLNPQSGLKPVWAKKNRSQSGSPKFTPGDPAGTTANLRNLRWVRG